MGADAPGSEQQQRPVQPELNAHGPPLGCFRVQTPSVQNSTVEHWESSLHGVPGHTPPKSWASPGAHWHVPPLAPQPLWVLHTSPPPGTAQQQESTQPELKLQEPPLCSWRVQTPLVQNSTDEHWESSLHGVPGQTPPKRWTSPALHSLDPPWLAQSLRTSQVALEALGVVQQHESRQPELNAHGPVCGCLRVHTPAVQNSTDEH